MRNSFIIFLSSAVILLCVFTVTGSRKPDTPLTGEFAHAISLNNLSGEIESSETFGLYDDKLVEIPSELLREDHRTVLGTSNQDRWIEVDLSEQKLRAWEGDSLFLETAVSTGLPWWPTPTGEFEIWIKLRATRMTGGSGTYAYDLPNVPYTMFIQNDEVPGWKGYGIHGAYWHNQFGTPRSHGCVNLPVEAAKLLYYWARPELPSGVPSVRANETNIGTKVVIHE